MYDVGDDVDDVGDDDGDDLSVAADSGLMQSGVAGGEREAREEHVDLDHHILKMFAITFGGGQR